MRYRGLCSESAFSGLAFSNYLEEEEAKQTMSEAEQDRLDQVREQKIEEEETKDETEESGSDGFEDSASDEGDNSGEESKPDESSTDEDAAPEEKDDKSENDGEEVAVSESLREIYYDRMVMEAIDQQDVIAGAKVVGGVIYDVLRGVISTMISIGVTVSPVIFRHLRRGVVYLFGKMVKVLLTTSESIKTKTRLRDKQLAKVKTEIDEVKNLLSELKPSESDEEPAPYSHATQLSWQVSKGRYSPSLSAQTMQFFLEKAIAEISSRVDRDLSSIERLIEVSRQAAREDVVTYLKILPLTGNFNVRNVEGYETDRETTVSYVYRDALPNRTLFIARIPVQGLNSLDDYHRAYHQTNFFLGIDQQAPVAPDQVKLMTLEELKKFVDQLEKIHQVCMAQRKFYVDLYQASQKLKLSYRHYWNKLVSGSERVGMSESLVELVYLKQLLIARGYVAGALDVHDYVTAYLMQSLALVRGQVKRYY